VLLIFGGKVETLKDALGRYVLQVRGRGKAEADSGSGREAPKEQFFSSLPMDGFTPDEEQLRGALLDVLNTWTAEEPPTLAHAGLAAGVRKFRVKVLPKGSPVTLRDWIDRRIGGEIEVFDGPSGQLHVGLRGHQGCISGTKKRTADTSVESGPPWKKGCSDS